MELLIVISVIAILAALLLPALNQARETARKISCVSNEKQIGLAIVQYNNDFNGFMPAWCNYKPSDGPDNRASWAAAAGMYIHPNRSLGQVMSIRYSRIFLCPSDGTRRKLSATVFRNDQYYVQSYIAVQEMFPFSNEGEGETKYTPTLKVEHIKNSSNTVIAGESFSGIRTLWTLQYSGYGADKFSYSTWTNADYPVDIRNTHGGSKQNFLYADGHIETCMIYNMKTKKFKPE